MAKSVILSALPLPPALKAALEETFDELLDLPLEDEELDEFLAKNATRIRGMVVYPRFACTREFISKLPSLEIVSTFSVGLDSIDLAACRERGIAVTNTPGVVTEDTADMAMALVLATMRRICVAHQFVKEDLWPKLGDDYLPLSRRVSGKRMGILGMGRIGHAIAKRAEGFDCSISYYSRSEKPELRYQRYSSLVELARDSDVLIVACTLTSETVHLVNKDVIDALGSKGTLINIARGPIVDEEELVAALQQGRLGAAGLDVFEKEPVTSAAMRAMDNVVMQPHAGTATTESRQATAYASALSLKNKSHAL